MTTCTCEIGEDGFLIRTPDCPLHSRKKTLLEKAHTVRERLRDWWNGK